MGSLGIQGHYSMLAIFSLVVTSMSSVTTTTTTAVNIAISYNYNDTSTLVAIDNNDTATDSNCTKDEHIGYLMARFGILPLAFLGILGNIAAFWIWHAETNYNATTFLFKYLALCDIMYLSFNVTFVFLMDVPCCYWYHAFVTHTRNFSQTVSVHTTLIVAISRWMAVCMPLRVHRFLTQRYVIDVCVILAAWCFVIETVEALRKNALPPHIDSSQNRALLASHEVFGYIVPWTLLLLFSLHLIWMTKRRLRESHFLQHDASLSTRPEDSTDVRLRRLTLTVLCVAFSSFLAYPIGVIVEMVSMFQFYRTCEGHVYYDTLATLGGLLQVINAGINVVFYWAFISRFRELLAHRLPRCVKGGDDSEDDNYTTEFSAQYSTTA
ncbi:G-protein coupled receptor 35-like [Littorina saxatilis]|uniref:G-protein coupled receptors family 1 profile domain-containing protein n=1 Tax=Littorina saxatilis TaxID=31220 RepID=A0AAN9AQ93_9CAEN